MQTSVAASDLSSLTSAPRCPDSAEEPQFRIATKRDKNKVEVKVETDKAVFSVHSPFGISRAIIQTDERNLVGSCGAATAFERDEYGQHRCDELKRKLTESMPAIF